MKIVVIGAALSGNKGAAAMLESTLQTLDKGIQFTSLSPYPVEDERLNIYPNLQILSYRPIYLVLAIIPAAIAVRLMPFAKAVVFRLVPEVEALAEASLVLDEGGITFSDGRSLFLIYNVASLIPPLILRRKVIKVSQALGPFKTVLNKSLAKYILPRMSLIFARGKYSFEFLQGLGLSNVVLAADYSFLLEIPGEMKIPHPIFKAKKLVGISPSQVIRRKLEQESVDYVRVMAEFCDWLVSQGYKVVMLPHSARPGTNKTHNNDLPLCLAIFSQIQNQSGCYLVEDELSPQELRYLIGRCQLFVASRFHAMVSALAGGVPVAVVGWSHKYREVLTMFDAEQYAIPYRQLSLDKLCKLFQLVEKDQKSYGQSLTTKLPEVKKMSNVQVQAIKDFIAANPD